MKPAAPQSVGFDTVTPHRDVDLAVKRSAFEHWFGVPPAPAGILVLLYSAAGQALTAGQLAVLASSSHASVFARICQMRSAMEAEAIDYEKGVGYRLTEIGMDECRSALDALVRSLVA